MESDREKQPRILVCGWCQQPYCARCAGVNRKVGLCSQQCTDLQKLAQHVFDEARNTKDDA